MLPDRTVFLLRSMALFLDEEESTLPLRIGKRFQLDKNALVSFRILRKGIDARKKSRIKYVYTVEFSVTDPERFWEKHRAEPDLELVETA